MRGMILSTLGAAGIAGLGYGLIPGGEVYALPASDVESKLRQMSLPDALGMNQPGSVNDVVVEGNSGHSVVWRMRTRGQTVGWIEAEMEPVDVDHTRVSVDFRMSEAATTGKDKDAAEFINSQKFVKAVGIAVIGEAVDATLEDREYDKGKVNGAIAAYALTHAGEVAQFGVDMRKLKEEMAEAETSRSSDSYARRVETSNPEAAARMRQYQTEDAMRAASAPMVDPTRPSRD